MELFKLLKLLKIFLLYIFISSSLYSATHQKYTTKDDNFISSFNVRHLAGGDNKNYPKLGDRVTIGFIALNPHTGHYYFNPKESEPTFDLVLGGFQSFRCWDMVIPRMSVGERIYFVCKADDVLEGKGNDFIPPNTDVGFELNLVDVETLDDNLKVEI